MPLPQLDETQQKELDTLIASKAEEFHKGKLAELGYDDHAKSVIEKRGKEAKEHRERAERVEKELKELRDAETKRNTDADAAKAELEKQRKAKEDDEKPLKDRLSGIEATFKEELDKRDKTAKAERKALEDKLKARDETLVKKSVISALKDKGALDADLIAAAIDLSVITVEDGDVNDEELTALIDSVVEERPHLFKKKDDDENRDETGRFVRPRSSSGKRAGEDASKLNDQEFEALEAGLRSGRV